MRWQGRKKSNNIDDRRSQPGAGRQGLGGRGLGGMGAGRANLLIRFLPMVLRFLGVKGTLLVGVAVVGYLYISGNTGLLYALLGSQNQVAQSDNSVEFKQSPEEAQLVDFISVALAETETTWTSLLSDKGLHYKEPSLVLFRNSVNSACGQAGAATGPFYCPADQQIYIDLSFYQELKDKFNAPGDFAQAYVLAHEVGHHVQTVLGTSQKVRQAKQGASKTEQNKLSVLQELQADCYAGLWAHAAQRQQLLDQGDIEEGLQAAAAIGDDRLQRRAGGTVAPDSFTHGSSAQRVKWFTVGFESGTLKACDTFS